MISVEKVTVNIGVGSAGEQLEKAQKLIEKITKQKTIKNITQKRIPSWGVRKGLEIGVKTTLRGKKADDFLQNALKAKEHKIPKKSFDKQGNFSFGIREYIDLPGFKYDPEIGMFGFDICVTLKKIGYRVKKRKISKSSIPKRHMISKEEAIEFAVKNLGIEVLD